MNGREVKVEDPARRSDETGGTGEAWCSLGSGEDKGGQSEQEADRDGDAGWGLGMRKRKRIC